jgi:hypothetical protein
MAINSPVHVRGGLIFTTEITITPHAPLQDAKLYLNNGWFQAMTLNALQPDPSSQEAQGNWRARSPEHADRLRMLWRAPADSFPGLSTVDAARAP